MKVQILATRRRLRESALPALCYVVSCPGSGASDPDKALRKIEDEIKSGKILVAVETDDPEIEQLCDRVFAEHGGERVG